MRIWICTQAATLTCSHILLHPEVMLAYGLAAPSQPSKPSAPGCEGLGVLPRPACNSTLALISRHAGRWPAALSHPSKVISSTNQAVKRCGCWRASACTAASGAHRQSATSPASALTGPSQLSSLVAASHVLAFAEQGRVGGRVYGRV